MLMRSYAALCRPWGDANVKVTTYLLDGAQALEEKGDFDEDNPHHHYGLRVASKLALAVGMEEFRQRYNEHNVPGPRGEGRSSSPTLLFCSVLTGFADG